MFIFGWVWSYLLCINSAVGAPGLLEGVSSIHMGPLWCPASFTSSEFFLKITPPPKIKNKKKLVTKNNSNLYWISLLMLPTLTSWRCERVNSLRKQSRGLFLVSWPRSWPSALFTCRLQTKMVLTEGRKFGVRGRAGNSKPKESWRP